MNKKEMGNEKRVMGNEALEIGNRKSEIGDEGDPVDAALRHRAAQVRPAPTFVNRLAARLRAARAAPARRRIPLWGWASAAVAVLLVVTLAVQALWPRGVPVAPTTQTPGVISTTPVETTAPVGPSATPPPTPETAPDFAAALPPAVATAIPRPGEEVNTKAGVLVRFTRPMDRASVEQALHVTAEDGRAQPLAGDFTWENDQVVAFKPKGLASGTRYYVSISPEARATNGLTLAHELVFAFSTVGPLTVTHTSPADAAANLRGDAPLLIAFNYPVVPLNCSGHVAEPPSSSQGEGRDGGCPPLALDIQPGVVGQGMWVNTSLYRFDPLPAWNAGTAYAVTLPAGLLSVDGAELAAAARFHFSTAAPAIRAIEPSGVNIPLETGVTVRFNTPMDRATSEAAFSLTDPQGAAIAGTFAWETDGMALVFTPTQRLAYETRYTAALNSGAQTLSGAALTEGASAMLFTTPPLRVTRIAPAYSDTPEKLDYHGSVRVDFAGLVDETTVSENIQVTRDGVPVADANVYWNTYEEPAYATVYWDKDAGVEYCIHVRPGVTDRYGVPLPEEVTRCFVVNDMPPLFASLVRQDTLTLDAAEAARLYFVAVNAAQVDLTLSTVSERRFASYADTVQPLGTLRTWRLTPGGATNASVVTAVDLNDGAPLSTGYYALEWRTSPAGESWWPRFVRFAVVDRHLTLKLSDAEALVWVTDLRTGTPIPGADVVLLNQVGNALGRGVSDADGIARFPIPQQTSRWEAYLAVSGTPGQPGFGVARSDWNANVSPWSFGINYNYDQAPDYQAYLHTDRPIYRPGQDVYFRGILRNDADGQYSVPPTDLVLRVQLTSLMGNYTAPEIEITPSEMGTFEGVFHLPDDAPLGSYQLSLVAPGMDYANWTAQFAVAAYRKPEFEVTVTPEQDGLLDGATLRALIEARYYSSGPVSHARVHWTLRAQPYTFAPDLAGWWLWDITIPGWNYWRDAEPLAEGDATTDAQGNLLLDFPADLQPLGEQETAGPQTWELEVTVTDEANFPVTGRGSVVIHAGSFYLGLKPQSWVTAAGTPALVDVRSVDWDAQPFLNQTVTLSLARRAWKYVPSKQPFGEDLWTYEDTVVETVSVATDDQGKAVASLTPPGSGAYVVLAESTDAAGHVIRSETYLWVSGGGLAAWKLPEGQVTPVADAKSYQAGDVARILLPTPFEAPYEVLMTLERGSFLEVRRFTATEANPLIEIPLTDAHVPNVIVSFVVVKGIGESADQRTPDVRIGMVELKVEPTRQLLTIAITPDCPNPPIPQSPNPPIPCTYAPGDTAALTLRATDVTGAPVDAEVALAVVDKAVLALADETTPSLRDAFYAPRPLRIVTGDGLLVLHNRVTADLAALEEAAGRIAKEAMIGGIGGGGGGDAMFAPDVRQDFPDTAFWEARVRTGPSGATTVSVKLPDSLTTWVADARAVTADTRVGQTTAEFIVTKPLLVRPVTPRFLTAGDQAEVAAIVQNNTDKDLDVAVQLQTNLQIIHQQITNQQISVPAGGRVRVSWMVDVAGAGPDAAELMFIAEGGGYRDAARPNVGRASDHALPIYRYETPDVMRATGALTEAGSRVEAVVVPPDAGPDSTLTVRLSPSLAAGMTGGLTYLEHFEHECTEQLVSRFLPNVVTYRALKDLGQTDPTLEMKLQELVGTALDKLYTRQNSDGGWGWWNDVSRPQITAYVVLGMTQAQRAGFPVDAISLISGVTYLERAAIAAARAETPLMTDAFTLYVLAEAGRTLPEGADTALFAARDRLDVVGRAYLALALGLANPEDARVATLLEDLRADAKLTASGAHWEQQDSETWITWTRATSVALDALARLAPEDPLLPQAVRWLMAARAKDRWETTQENAWAIIALTDYMLATGELQADYPWGLAFNTEALAEGQATPETLRQTVERVIPVSAMLREWPNALEISRGEGHGTLYYTADLAVYLPAEQLEAESNGFTVQRQYCAPSAREDEAQTWYGRAIAFAPCAPLTSARPGDLVEVRLTVTAPHYRNYVVLEDFYPAGMEPVDPTLKTEQSGTDTEAIAVERDTRTWWWWGNFGHHELRDERAVFYAETLAPGTYQVRYVLRAAIPGAYKVLPATISEMYFPDVRGRSAGEVFMVEE